MISHSLKPSNNLRCLVRCLDESLNTFASEQGYISCLLPRCPQGATHTSIHPFILTFNSMNFPESSIFARPDNEKCRSLRWPEIMQFILFNYVLHAVTILSRPGDGIISSTYSRLIVFLLPLVGMVRAVQVIHRFARGEGTPLHIAIRAQALCMIGPAVSTTLFLRLFANLIPCL